MTATRQCKDCAKTLPVEEFVVSQGRLRPRCKPCHRLFRRQYSDGQQRRMPRRADEIPSGPFVEWLAEFVTRYDLFAEACQSLDTPERLVYRWLKRPGPWVPEATVDRVFCAVGQPYQLRALYPELDEEQAA